MKSDLKSESKSRRNRVEISTLSDPIVIDPARCYGSHDLPSGFLNGVVTADLNTTRLDDRKPGTRWPISLWFPAVNRWLPNAKQNTAEAGWSPGFPMEAQWAGI